MASIIDSCKNVFSDSYPGFKMGFLSLLIFCVVQLWKTPYMPPSITWTSTILLVLLTLGFILLTVHNTINEKNILMPNFFNPFKLISIAIMGIAALLPTVALLYFILTTTFQYLVFEPYINYIILYGIFILFFPIIALQLLLFAKHLNIKGAYDLKYINKVAGDFIIHTFIMFILLAICPGLLFITIGYAAYMMFGQGVIMDFFVVFSIVTMVMCAMQYYSQLYFEFIDLVEF